jgi:hypothetical protein
MQCMACAFACGPCDPLSIVVDTAGVLAAHLQAKEFRQQLEAAGVRCDTDLRTNYTPGEQQPTHTCLPQARLSRVHV